MTPRYLALDPGETTGWATFDANGVEVEMGQFKQKDLHQSLDRLITSELYAVICEEYRNYGHKQQKRWSRNQTSKNEGAIEMICNMRGVKFCLQQAAVKVIGYKWGGSPGPPSNHAISHQFDAWAHGIYWLQQNGIRPVGMAILEQEKNNGH